ncbi:MAG: triose-phosphate isomerase [Euryarchaeota archaeon]|nr:triose-phosphate isomerase [Euryarchaeota archaeon]
MLKTPVILVNFKLYSQASGKNAVRLAKLLDSFAEESGVSVSVAVNALDFSAVSEAVNIPVFLQHVDAVEFGAHTGRINVELAKEHGAAGVLVNHSERRMRIADIEHVVSHAKQVGLTTVVCTNNPAVSGAIAALRPDFIAMEPPELIGGNVSVSRARPEAITETIEIVRKISDVPVLVGAGVKTGDDVRKSIELGAVGVLVASGITKAKDPKKAIEELAGGL